MKKKIIIITAISFWIDQIIKYLVYKNVLNISIIHGFLSLVYVENKGVAFSMLSGNKLLIITVSLLLILFLIYELNNSFFMKSKKSNLLTVSYGILFGGIFGNLFDRIFREGVIDYISIRIFGYYFPVFNLADVLITVGVIIFLIDMFVQERNTKFKKKELMLK